MGSYAAEVTPSPCILWQMVGGCCCCPSLVEYPGPEEVMPHLPRPVPLPATGSWHPSPGQGPLVAAGWRWLGRCDVSAISFSSLFEVGFCLLEYRVCWGYGQQPLPGRGCRENRSQDLSELWVSSSPAPAPRGAACLL